MILLVVLLLVVALLAADPRHRQGGVTVHPPVVLPDGYEPPTAVVGPLLGEANEVRT